MTEVERITDQLKRAFEGPAWHGPAVLETLEEKFNPTGEEDWPRVSDASEAAWKQALARLKSGHAALRGVVGSFDPDRLEAPLVPGGSTGYVQFHGAVQHDLWHAGQIMILKKG
jgi:hypothetical protein